MTKHLKQTLGQIQIRINFKSSKAVSTVLSGRWFPNFVSRNGTIKSTPARAKFFVAEQLSFGLVDLIFFGPSSWQFGQDLTYCWVSYKVLATECLSKPAISNIECFDV